jgi:transcription initiation factor TFIIIB Brf1 subunit/transcription initiation factor TFIIB
MTIRSSALADQQDAQVPALLAALQRAQERITELEHERDQLRHECGKLRQEMRWIDQLLAVPAAVMSPSHKVTLRAVVKEIQSHPPDARGLVEIKSWELCQTVGQSKETFLTNLNYCAEQLGLLRKHVERPGLAQGDFSANYFLGVTDRLAHPHMYTVNTPRQHGGPREVCPHCHSERLKKKVTVTCQDCGAVLRESSSDVNTDATGNLTRENNQNTQRQVDDGYPQPEQEPATPPCVGSDETGSPQAENDDKAQDQHDQVQGEQRDQADIMTAATRLLVEIAGPEPVHIEMSPRGPKKYYDVHRAITEQDACAHLQGCKTKGACLRHPGGMTRALCYDADTPQDWDTLRTAARFLSYGDFCPLLEASPVPDDEHTGGGHLWIIFTDLVKASWAHQRALQYAPMLREINESWPSPRNHKVRLPGGKYVKPGGFAHWCSLSDAHGKPLATDGPSAARVLLDAQTPADIVPEYPGSEDGGHCPGPQPSSTTDHQAQACSEQNGTPGGDDMQAGTDQRWHHTYSHHLWFHFTPAQLAAWYNERNQVKAILPPEHNGMGLASWRGERTASVGFREEGWVDFGASARRRDGKPDGGDALELTVRLNDEPKPQVMRQLARQLVSQAREALEIAAHCSEPPPQWVQAFMSPAGWEHYRHLREEAGHSDQAMPAIPEPAPYTRGVGGLYPLDTDASARHTHHGQEPRQLQDAAQTVPAQMNRPHETVKAWAAEPVSMHELELMRDYGRAQEWAALIIDGEEIIPAGRAHW